ncbi:MAG: DUF4070 domain-containing protein, partial [Cytophagales bacterium]|nr:DUF4070 domain-containing protein [Cytophagales bacterium]
ISKKAAHPPLGLITVAAMLPEPWKKKLVDLNIASLKEADIQWADYILVSAMSVQSKSVNEIIARCKKFNKKIIAGGPLFTAQYESFLSVDHLVLDEAEITLQPFLEDLEKGVPKHIYSSGEFADVTETPIPDYSLLQTEHYASLSIQYTRGCPFNCDFCDITALFGKKVRAKSTAQIIAELDHLNSRGYKGSLFFVDDNFIGNRRVLKKELLPAIIRWMEENDHPFYFQTEASVNLADDEALMKMMVKAGFSKVFVGIETPEEASLVECSKTQNNNRDLIEAIQKIQSFGMEVTAGFIVGFDNDSPSIFQRQIDFIQKSGIISAMVGLLNAPKKTRLYERLHKEGRILNDFDGDNTNFALNFIPKMNKEDLLEGYQKILHGIYSCRPYFERVKKFLAEFEPGVQYQTKVNMQKIKALFRSIIILGVLDKGRKYYWKLFFWSLFRKPKVFPLAITYAVFGFHYRKVFIN